MDPKEILRVSLRDNYRRFWWLHLFALGVALIYLISQGQTGTWILLLIPLLFLTPFLKSFLMVRQIKNAPLNLKEYVGEFDDVEFRQLAEMKVVASVKYCDFHKVKLQPEGIQIYMTPLGWALIPKSAFQTKEQFDMAYGLFLNQKGS